jgi:hypothetical protein
MTSLVDVPTLDAAVPDLDDAEDCTAAVDVADVADVLWPVLALAFVLVPWFCVDVLYRLSALLRLNVVDTIAHPSSRFDAAMIGRLRMV